MNEKAFEWPQKHDSRLKLMRVLAVRCEAKDVQSLGFGPQDFALISPSKCEELTPRKAYSEIGERSTSKCVQT